MLRWAENRTRTSIILRHKDRGISMGETRVASPHSQAWPGIAAGLEAEFDGQPTRLCYGVLCYFAVCLRWAGDRHCRVRSQERHQVRVRVVVTIAAVCSLLRFREKRAMD